MFCFLIFTHLFLCKEAGEREEREEERCGKLGTKERREEREKGERGQRGRRHCVKEQIRSCYLPNPTVIVYPKFKINVSRVKLGLYKLRLVFKERL